MGEFRLSERQRVFAEENHSILTDFLDFRKLPVEEYYDVVIFSFLKAVKSYDEREDLKRYEFESVAKNRMRAALDTYFKSEREKDELMHIVSLDYIPKNVSCDTVLDCIDIADLVCEKLSRTDEGSGLLHKTSYNGNLEVVIA